MNTASAPKPDSTPEMLAQAIQLQQRGRFPDAERIFRTLLHAEPSQPDALHFLGLLEFQTDRKDAGLDHLRQSVEKVPGNAGFRYNLANALLSVNQGPEALLHFKRCAALEPENGDVCQGLAMALSSQDQPEQAVDTLTSGLAKHPGHRGCWLTLSLIQENLGLLPEALAAARHAWQLDRKDPETSVRLASLLLLLDRPHEAGPLLDAAIDSNPRDADAHYHRANLFMSFGRFPQARAELEKVIELNPDYSEAYIRLATIGGLHLGTPLQEKLEQRIEHALSNDELSAKLNIRFALGKVWQTAGEYDRAFHHFEIGNRLRRASLSYSSSASQEHFDQIRTLHNAEFLARAASCGSATTAPIFIVGMPRSGTSLVEQILSKHPQVHAGGELKLLTAALYRCLRADFRRTPVQSATRLRDDELRLIAARYLADIQALAPQAPFVTDKMPANFVHLGLIHVLYPQARVIHCYRDARDNCVSLHTTLFNSGHAYTSDLTELGEYYRGYYELMRHWRSVLPAETLLDMRYEDLVEDTQDQVRQLLAHCRLNWDPACLDFSASERPVRTASVYQVRQSVYHSSVGRWRHYESHLEPLLAALKDIV